MPTNPSRIPTSRRPVTRWLRSTPSAKTAVKIGAEALRIAASPESMYCWPQVIRKNGNAVLNAPISASGTTYARRPPKPLPRSTM